ncbi:MAG: MotA/TolQ/ExbB proton channel family protein [Planctomycetota bacterium]
MREWFLKGGPVMWPLLGCSVIGLTFVLERLLFWARVAWRRDGRGVDQVLEAVRAGRSPEAHGIARTLRDGCGLVLIAGIEAPDGGHARAMEAAGRDVVSRMKRSMGVIDTVITVAPLLGILGTVTGIINAFNLLGGGLAENQAGVTAGLAEALITTVAGLVISIPCICFYNYFLSRIDRETARLEDAGTRLELLLHEKESPRVEIAR